MKLYNVLLKKNKEGKIEDIILLKDGFCWMAFFFSIFWFLYHKMWKESFVLFSANIAIAILSSNGVITGEAKFFLEIIFAIFIAINANYWLLESLKTRGYEFSGLIFGSNAVSAKIRFMKDLESDLENMDFDNSIVNPKLHHQLRKLKKREQYFIT